jgi:hypothetical protein
MGSSKDIAIGPVAVVSLLLGSLLQNEVDYNKNKEEYLRLAFTATFFAGITQAALGFLRYTIRQYFSKINMQTQVGASKLRTTIFQVRFPHRILVACCNCRIHGWSSHNNSPAAAEICVGYQAFYKGNRHNIGYGVCLGFSSSWGTYLEHVTTLQSI